MQNLESFLTGALTFGFVIASLLFLKAWRTTSDSLFAAFGAAFLLLALNQLAGLFGALADEQQAWVFLLRLAAFLLLIVAIVVKNMRAGRAA